MDWNGIRTVVVPVDLEQAPRSAVTTALQAAKTPAGVHIVYVLPELEPSLTIQIDTAHRLANAEQSLLTWLAEHRFEGVTPHVRVGRAARAVVDLATELGADLVIVEAWPHGAVSRALIGSVAERIARQAPCPTLLMRPSQ